MKSSEETFHPVFLHQKRYVFTGAVGSVCRSDQKQNQVKVHSHVNREIIFKIGCRGQDKYNEPVAAESRCHKKRKRLSAQD